MRIRFLLLGLLALPLAASAGQTNADKLLTRLSGVPSTEIYDLDARIDLLEASVPADEVTYTPAVLADWDGSADPGDVDAALDQLAERVTDQVDAGGLTYTPTVLTDWDGNADPGDLDDALNQLGERVDDVELAGGISYTPAVGGNWVDPDPTLVSGALDDLAGRVAALETAAAKGRLVTVTVGAEAADFIAITIEIDDLLGVDVADGQRLELGLFTDQFFQSVSTSGNYAVVDAGDGSIETSDGMNNRHIILSGGGVSRVQLTVQDIAGGSGATLYGLARVVGATPVFSAPIRFVVTFDGV